MIDDRIIGKSDRDAAIICDTAGIALVAGDRAAVAAGAAVGRQEVPARGNRRAIIDGHTRGNTAGIVGAAYLPAADINWSIAVVIEFDELVVGSVWTTGAELADYDWGNRCR